MHLSRHPSASLCHAKQVHCRHRIRRAGRKQLRACVDCASKPWLRAIAGVEQCKMLLHPTNEGRTLQCACLVADRKHLYSKGLDATGANLCTIVALRVLVAQMEEVMYEPVAAKWVCSLGLQSHTTVHRISQRNNVFRHGVIIMSNLLKPYAILTCMHAPLQCKQASRAAGLLAHQCNVAFGALAAAGKHHVEHSLRQHGGRQL